MGISGYTGYTGPQVTGYTGPTGYTGYTGWTGPNGPLVDYPFNVLNYGAVGNGSTDNVVAFNAAMTAAAAFSSGGTVYVPAGQFLLASHIIIPYNVNLVMDPGAQLIASSAMDAVLIVGPTVAVNLPGTNMVGGVINCNALAANGVYVRSCRHFTIKDTYVKYPTTNGFLIGDITDFPVHGSGGFECYLENVHVYAATTAAGAGVYCTGAITDNRVDTAVIVGCATGVRTDTGACWFTDIHAYGGAPASANPMAVCFYDNSQFSTWTNCYADSPTEYGWYIAAAASNTKLVGNTVFNNSDGSDNVIAGVYCANTTPVITILGMAFEAGPSQRIAQDIANVSSFAGSTIAGLTWQNVVLIYSPQNQIITLTIDGKGSVPSTGSYGYIQVPYNATITGWTMLANASGTAQITVKKCAYASLPTTVSIVASAPPNLTGPQQFNTSTNIGTWTTSLLAGDVLEFNLDSAGTVTRLNLDLFIVKA
jgi:hypothetical protein